VATPRRSERSAAEAFELRAARAESLIAAGVGDAEPLRFAAGLLRAQASSAAGIEGRAPSGSLRSDLASILEPAVLTFVARNGPAAIAAAARTRASEDQGTANDRLLLYWNGDRTSAEDYLSRALLRPYVETLRALGVTPDRAHARGRCPFCGGAAGIARRRSGESEGAVRSLVCALCGLEWEIGRIRCPSCAEDDPRRLPSFTSESHPIVRIEACDTCARYVKSIDTSLDGRIVPEVDEITSLAMDLWAREQGFERIEPGIAGA
jgi:formate dehydrogenase accessory protein FdhE